VLRVGALVVGSLSSAIVIVISLKIG